MRLGEHSTEHDGGQRVQAHRCRRFLALVRHARRKRETVASERGVAGWSGGQVAIQVHGGREAKNAEEGSELEPVDRNARAEYREGDHGDES